MEWSSETFSGLLLTLSQSRATQQEQWRVFPFETKTVTLECSLADYKKEWSTVEASGRLGRSTKPGKGSADKLKNQCPGTHTHAHTNFQMHSQKYRS